MWDLSSLIRDQTCIPCIARQMLNYWTTREAPGRLSLRNWLLLILWLVQSIELGTQDKPLTETKEKVVRGAHLWFPERWAPRWWGELRGSLGWFSDIGQPQYSSSWEGRRQCLGEPVSPSSPDGFSVVYLLFGHSVMSYSLWPHGLQHARLHHLPEFAQTHVHRVGDAIQPSHPLSPPSSPAHNLSQHQDLFQWVSSSHQVATGSFSICPSNEYSGLISFRTDWFDLPAMQEMLKSLLQHHILKLYSSVLSIIYGPTLTM